MKWKAIGLFALAVVGLAACQSESDLEFARYYAGGKVVYQSKCQNCHGSDGKGLGALIPPLTDLSKYKTDKVAMACLIKYGSSKSLNTAANTFGDKMPATDLPTVDIAKVTTYVTNSYGNKQGTTTTQQAEEYLKKCR
ncbi:c-type cytochrome [Mucilaginibacter auburnensis]|uniref:Mono/diheme cytochrome c family protein n=1 Tax=Mucilaginibacter auburnensis TaxID=1457233 RepID=A0A2H9VW68_9SPHI|nr:cytochrome c [Mucilaginibacter auburnensis]PJJ85067.1 mono/diheme cytochrome c family protein [Mucilaginibacter auburnensis]